MEHHHLSMGISTILLLLVYQRVMDYGIHDAMATSIRQNTTYCQGAQSPNATPASKGLSKGTLQKNAWKMAPT